MGTSNITNHPKMIDHLEYGKRISGSTLVRCTCFFLHRPGLYQLWIQISHSPSVLWAGTLKKTELFVEKAFSMANASNSLILVHDGLLLGCGPPVGKWLLNVLACLGAKHGWNPSIGFAPMAISHFFRQLHLQVVVNDPHICCLAGRIWSLMAAVMHG